MTALVLNLWPGLAAALGFAIAAYAAMETEVDDIKRRTAFGIGGVAMMGVGILLI